MTLLSFASNAKEYEARCQQDFVAPNVSLKELRDAVPKAVFKKSTVKGLYYVVRNALIAFALLKFARCIDALTASLSTSALDFVVCWSLWVIYWYLQGLVWGGFWTLGACARSMYAVSSVSCFTRSRGSARCDLYSEASA